MNEHTSHVFINITSHVVKQYNSLIYNCLPDIRHYCRNNCHSTVWKAVLEHQILLIISATDTEMVHFHACLFDHIFETNNRMRHKYRVG